jgi:hypothetical protein
VLTLLVQRFAHFIRSTSNRTFFIYPLLVLAWELLLQGGDLRWDLRPTPLLFWGYLQYKLCGVYRTRRGGGGPGFDNPPERLVTSGLYAYTRNPMYLGHLIFLLGLTLTLRSLLAAVITVASAVWFHRRVVRDERRLLSMMGEPYREYLSRVSRWIPGLF